MAKPKGSVKTGGKKKGYTSEPVKKAQELFVATLEGQVEHIAKAFDKVRLTDPEKYLELFAKYAQYFIPKKTEVDNHHKFEDPAIVDWGNSTKASLPTAKTKQT